MNEKNLSKDIGKRIYERRKKLNITQEQLSELTESTPQAISNYERGERELKASSIIKISEALNTTTDYLLTGRDNAFVIENNFMEINSESKRIIYEIIEKCLSLLK